jgi:hypothetical protein
MKQGVFRSWSEALFPLGLILFFYLAIALVCVARARGQEPYPDVISRPTAVCELTGGTLGVGDPPHTFCWYIDGTDYLDPANHVVCTPVAGLNQVVTVTTPAPLGSGTMVFRGVVINDEGISEPSPNTDTCPDLSVPPVAQDEEAPTP